jgi:hypothetical protein
MIASIVCYKGQSVLQKTLPQLRATQIETNQAISSQDSGESKVQARRIRREKVLTFGKCSAFHDYYDEQEFRV